MERPAERLAQAYRTWSESRGAESDHWLDLTDARIEMRSVLTEDVPDDLAGSRYSHVGVKEYLQSITRDWEMLSFEVERIIDGGDDVVMVGRCAWRNRATGKVVDTPKVDVWRFADGQAVSYLEMFDSLGFLKATPIGIGMA